MIVNYTKVFNLFIFYLYFYLYIFINNKIKKKKKNIKNKFTIELFFSLKSSFFIYKVTQKIIKDRLTNIT